MTSITTKPAPLTAKNKNSFAYPTMKDRVPVIICKVIDLLHRNRGNRTQEGREDLKKVVEELSKLRYELQTNKPLKEITDGLPNARVWNDYIDQEAQREGQDPTWFNSKWLLSECYVYRRMLQSVTSTTTMKDEDFFGIPKRESFHASWPATQALLQLLTLMRKDNDDAQKRDEHLKLLLKISLWGNKCDLSISSGNMQSFDGNPATAIKDLEANVLLDQSDELVACVNRQGSKLIDLVLDNVGFELISDLCLADFLVSSHLANRVRLRVKDQPWFVSDTMIHDIHWTMDELLKQSSQAECSTSSDDIVSTVNRWKEYLHQDVWTVHADPFWTYPQDFSYMKTVDPSLYNELSKAQVVIFKGDLNYRKLVGDLDWHPTTTFVQALQGFLPAPIAALRTLKSDVVSGLKEGQCDDVTQRDKDWMVNGKFAMVQYCNA